MAIIPLVSGTKIVCYKELQKLVGRSESIFLSQLHFWLSQKKGGVYDEVGTHWIYNTAQTWANQLDVSISQIKRNVKKLRDLKVLVVNHLSKKKYDRTNYYTIDYEMLEKLIGQKPMPINQAEKLDSEGIDSLKPTEMYIGSFRANGEVQNEPTYIRDNYKEDNNKSARESSDEEQVEQVNDDSLKQENKVIKSYTAQKMLKIWNESFQKKDEERMSKQIAPLLVSAYQHKFDNNLSLWRKYCEKIKSSAYIMGENFRLCLSWALKFGTIDRIHKGELGVEKTMKELNKIDSPQAELLIAILDEPDEIKKVRRYLVQLVGPEAYHAWFHRGKYHKDGSTVYFEAPSSFTGDRLEQQHYPFLKRMENEDNLTFLLQSKERKKAS